MALAGGCLIAGLAVLGLALSQLGGTPAAPPAAAAPA
ncbi:MAG: hypothetical protein QOF12_634, partial [Solirubrobacteraceae bacterium]|nr:hypothetical protein [Solirubrobacteraceae bacterium]